MHALNAAEDTETFQVSSIHSMFVAHFHLQPKPVVPCHPMPLSPLRPAVGGFGEGKTLIRERARPPLLRRFSISLEDDSPPFSFADEVGPTLNRLMEIDS